MKSPPRTATAAWCFGRSVLSRDIIQAAFEDGAVLLFGGRQSGKTTLLLRITQTLGERRANVKVMDEIDVPVYVDLMRLAPNDGPKEFFAFLAMRAAKSCSEQIDGFEPPTETELRHGVGELDSFVEYMKLVLRQCGEVGCRFLFLLDEAKRIATGRFPRGVQENLFALLYDPEVGLSGRIGLVFAGAQDLNAFCVDETSPLGSRAALRYITNLDHDSLLQFCQETELRLDDGRNIVEELWAATGGHAGLSARVLDLLTRDSELTVSDAAKQVRRQRGELFRLWASSFSEEALALAFLLRGRTMLTMHEAIGRLKNLALSPLGGERARSELEYTGVAIESPMGLKRVNNIFWDYANEVDLGASVGTVTASYTTRERDVWSLIERVELNLRTLIRKRYEDEWNVNALQKMRAHVGEKNWQKFEDLRKRSEQYYPFSPGWTGRDVMECMYLGDLQTLIVHGSAWALFKPIFDDKKKFENFLGSILPVRNDRAHFASVPEKELRRCELACEDLLVLVERALNGD